MKLTVLFMVHAQGDQQRRLVKKNILKVSELGA